MIVLTKKYKSNTNQEVNCQLYLTSEERRKAKQKIKIEEINGGEDEYIKLDLGRGTILEEGDILTNEGEDFFVNATKVATTNFYFLMVLSLIDC